MLSDSANRILLPGLVLRLGLMDKRDVAGVRAVAAQVVKTAQTCHAQARSRAMIMEAVYEQVQTSTPPTQLAVSL